MDAFNKKKISLTQNRSRGFVLTCWEFSKLEILHSTSCDQWLLGVVQHKTLKPIDVKHDAMYILD
jgi:hypothetical protein